MNSNEEDNNGTERTCEYCKYWSDTEEAKPVTGELRECQRHCPTANGTGRGIWPLSSKDDTCGEFFYKPGYSENHKITDEQIFEMIRKETNENVGYPCKRSWLVKAMQDVGMARTSASDRVKRMVKKGKICVGFVNPPHLKYWKTHHVVVWVNGSPPQYLTDEPVVAPAGEARKRGRPAYDDGPFYRLMWTVGKDNNGTKEQLIAGFRKVFPTMSNAAAHRLIQKLYMQSWFDINKTTGKIECDMKKEVMEELERRYEVKMGRIPDVGSAPDCPEQYRMPAPGGMKVMEVEA